jgi:hypothetical protein
MFFGRRIQRQFGPCGICRICIGIGGMWRRRVSCWRGFGDTKEGSWGWDHESISEMGQLVKSYESLGWNEQALRRKGESMTARRTIYIAQRSRNFEPAL